MSQTIKIQKHYEMDYFEQVKLGLWNRDCTKLEEYSVLASIDNHHAFAVNWIQHKNRDLLNHVHFNSIPQSMIKNWAIEVRLLDNKVFPPDVKYLEDRGAVFLKDGDYQKLLYGILLEIGT